MGALGPVTKRHRKMLAVAPLVHNGAACMLCAANGAYMADLNRVSPVAVITIACGISLPNMSVPAEFVFSQLSSNLSTCGELLIAILRAQIYNYPNALTTFRRVNQDTSVSHLSGLIPDR